MAELIEAALAGVVWLLAFASVVVVVQRRTHERLGPILLASYALFFAAQVLLANALGMMGLLTSPAVRAVYGLAVAGGVVAYVRGRRSPGPAGWPGPGGGSAAKGESDSLDETGRTGVPEAADRLVRRLALLVVAAVFAGAAIFTLLSPVHIWDVLAYHMVIVASYIQNASLDAWPTQDLRQIFRVNGGEIQMVNVALLARSDAWVELPNLLALSIVLVATFELARLAFRRPAYRYLAVLLVLTAPQIIIGTSTAKNDLVFTAVLLSAFYWMVRAGSAPQAAAPQDVAAVRPAMPSSMGGGSYSRGPTSTVGEATRAHPGGAPAGAGAGAGAGTGTGASAHVALAGLSAALAGATKVMGLNVVGAVGVLALVLVQRKRLQPRHVLIYGGVAVAALLLLVGKIYLFNAGRSAVPVGIAPGETHFTVGLANLVDAARLYFYDIPIRRLLARPIFEHDLMHYGYLYPFLLVFGLVAAFRQLRRRSLVPASLALMGGALVLSVIAVRRALSWDQRFMIWLVPTFVILALSLAERLEPRRVTAIAWLSLVLAAGNLGMSLALEYDFLLGRSAAHLVSTGDLARYLDVPNRRYTFMNEGLDAVDRTAAPGDSILYAGTDDSWMYPLWGARFTRHVEGVWDAAHARDQVASRDFRFLVIEAGAVAEIRRAAESEATAAGYVVLASADDRTVFVRNDALAGVGQNEGTVR